MKQNRSLKARVMLAAAVVLALANALGNAREAGAQRFEGIITVRVAGAARGSTAPPPEAEYFTRKGKVRVAVGSGASAGAVAGVVIIMIPEEQKLYTLIPSGSMYVEADMNAAPAPPGPAPTITRTKRTEMIAGHRCEHILIGIGKKKTDVCMAKGLGTYVVPSGLSGGEAWQRALAEANGFPLKVQDADGSITMEVLKIQRKTLSESLFEVPDNYTRVENPMRRQNQGIPPSGQAAGETSAPGAR